MEPILHKVYGSPTFSLVGARLFTGANVALNQSMLKIFIRGKLTGKC